MDQPNDRDEKGHDEIGRLARELGVPADSYGKPDWSHLRELHQWWLTEIKPARSELRELVEWWRTCTALRKRSIAWVLGFAGTGGAAMLYQVWPAVREWLRAWFLTVLSN